jgi:hypothetical protein
MPNRHDVRKEGINAARLASVLDLAYNREIEKFEDLVDMHGVGPRTLKALAMASEVIHGDTTRFEDPARFAFAVGGKDGRPHPIDTKSFDETVTILQDTIDKSKMGDVERLLPAPEPSSPPPPPPQAARRKITDIKMVLQYKSKSLHA